MADLLDKFGIQPEGDLFDKHGITPPDRPIAPQAGSPVEQYLEGLPVVGSALGIGYRGARNAAAGFNAGLAGLLGLPSKLAMDIPDAATTLYRIGGDALGIPRKYLPDGLINREGVRFTPEWWATQMGKAGITTMPQDSSVASAIPYGLGLAASAASTPLPRTPFRLPGELKSVAPLTRIDPITGSTPEQVSEILAKNRITSTSKLDASAPPIPQELPTKTATAAAAAANIASNVAPVLAASQGYSPETQAMLGLVPGAAATLGGGLAKRVLRGSNTPQEVAQRVRTLRDAGVTDAPPSVYLDGVWPKYFDSLMSTAPGSNLAYAKGAMNINRELGQTVKNVADNIYPNATIPNAGDALKSGVEAWNEAQRAQSEQNYNKLFGMFPEGSRFPVTQTLAAIQDIHRPIPGAENTSKAMVVPGLKRTGDAITKDVSINDLGAPMYPFEALKAVRSEVGANTKPNLLTKDTDTKKWNQLYAAMSDDLENAALLRDEQAGLYGPDKTTAPPPSALAQFSVANNFHRGYKLNAEKLQPFKNKDNPEDAYSLFQSKSTSSPRFGAFVLDALPEEEARQVTAARIGGLGLQTPGANDNTQRRFSAHQFLTDWNKMRQRGTGTADYMMGLTEPSNATTTDAGRMRAVAQVASWMKDAKGPFGNPSGSGQMVANLGAGTAVLGALASGHAKAAIAAGLGYPAMYGLGRLGMSPWLQDRLSEPMGLTAAQRKYMLLPQTRDIMLYPELQ